MDTFFFLLFDISARTRTDVELEAPPSLPHFSSAAAPNINATFKGRQQSRARKCHARDG